MGWRSDLRSGRFRLLWGFVLLTGMSCGILLGVGTRQEPRFFEGAPILKG